MSQQINLFNPIFLKQEKYFSAVTMSQALGLILSGLIALSVYAYYRSTVLAKDAEETKIQLAAIKGELAKFDTAYGVRQKTKSLEDEITTTENDVKSLQQVLDILQKGRVGNTKGYAEYMRAFARQISSGIWLTGFRIIGAGNDIEIQGRALRPELVPAYISRLKREPVLQGKSFSALEMKLPDTDKDDKKSSTDTKAQQLPYIEFVLQSSDTLKSATDGEKDK